jgi:hypothetical protein
MTAAVGARYVFEVDAGVVHDAGALSKFLARAVHLRELDIPW